jgi:CheY-like chemotaxis protein
LTTGGRVHVVVVDDRPDRRRVLTATLRSGALAEADVTEVDEAALALALVRSRPVDAVLVEIGLPGSLDLIAEVRRLDAAMVILVCSFTTDPKTRELAAAAGATAYLAKPVSARQLHRAIVGASASASASATARGETS